MKAFKRVLSLLLVLAALLSTQLATSVSAATTTKKYDCDKSVTMTVKTGNKAASMNLVCKAATEKQTVNRVLFGKKTYTHTCSVAPKMVIKVSPRVNGVQYFYLQGWGKTISSTLKLNKNTTYTITISYYYNSCNTCRCNTMDFGLFHNADLKCYANGMWQVAGSKNLDIKSVTVR